jgi:hypothetical protein
MATHEGRQRVVERIVGHWEHPKRGMSGAGKIPYGIEVERGRLLVVGPLGISSRPGRAARCDQDLRRWRWWYLVVDQP